ncbi:DUF3810 domain-containing protein [Bacteroides sp. 519]|uniref:DUF3810 domain-containing protein n=1 Tax=Bacteroides sp. 519 TaxID=2302937 RepID=UPI0013D1DDA5|nr:DUF3810 domain-containing protein [Bacteroides sp. 519]NDV59448.1 DUF3810 domain-containing protein [Bacteroides sp. 519]
MKKKYFLIIRYSILIILLFVIQITKITPSWGEVYSRSLYPAIAKTLSGFSGLFPFSVGDLFILLAIIGLFVGLIYARFHKIKFKKRLLGGVEYLLWIYVWFYLAWGLNYGQPNFYQRTGIEYVAYNKENFREFLDAYVTSLNKSYVPISKIDKEITGQIINNEYKKEGLNPGIHTLQGNPRAKTMLFSSLFSKMAILGYMGPFFCEFNLNRELPVSQYASSYAHELSHFLGITNEAEASFYAYLICSRSDEPTIRFCGYLSVMNYVLNNASALLTEDEFREVYLKIKPEIMELAKTNRKYWQDKYSKTIGEVQDWIYDLYLKGNNIPSGRKNYSEVVGLMVSWYYS